MPRGTVVGRLAPALTTYDARVDMGTHLTAIWRRLWWIALSAVCAAGVVLGIRSAAPPVYQATSTLRVTIASADPDRRAETVGFYADTVAGLAETPDVLEAAIAASALTLTLDEAAARISVADGDGPGFLELTATGPDTAAARALADAAGDALAARLAEDNARAVEAATAPLRVQLDELDAALADLAEDDPRRSRLELAGHRARRVDRAGRAGSRATAVARISSAARQRSGRTNSAP